MSGRCTSRIGIVAALAVAVAFTASLAVAQSLKSLSQLRVFDATGKKVGRVLSVKGMDGRNPVVALQFGKHVFTVEVLRHRFRGNVEGVYFQSADCSGMPYLQAYLGDPALFGDQGGDLLDVYVGAPGNTVYLPTPGSTTQPTPVQSRLVPTGECTLSGDASLPAVPALPLIDLNMVFTPPFSVR